MDSPGWGGSGKPVRAQDTGRYPDSYVASEYGEFALRVVGYAG